MSKEDLSPPTTSWLEDHEDYCYFVLPKMMREEGKHADRW